MCASVPVGTRSRRAPRREAIHWDPLREEGHRRLLKVLAAKGDHAAVHQAYSSLRQLLGEELGVSPSPSTEAAFLEALGTEPALPAGDTSTAATPARSWRQPFPTALAAHATTLVGREAELVWLWSLWRRARPGAPLTAVISGPVGAGKRSLAAAFASEVSASGGSVEYRDATSVEPIDHHPTGRPHGTAALLAVIELNGNRWRPEINDASLVVLLSTCPGAQGDAAELLLGPLDRAAVEALAEERLGRPPHDDEAAELWAITGGWPGAVIDGLTAWTAERAELLVRTGASAVAAVASSRDDLADEVLRRRARHRGPPAIRADRRPYKGLLRFEPDDADLFFGRDQLVADLLARVATERLIVVVGASGSGKSSVIRAGLVADLRRGVLPGSERWPILLLTPGRDPLGSLAACLRASASRPDGMGIDVLLADLDQAAPSIVVVDQFEEVFTAATDDEQRRTFVEALCRGLGDTSSRRRLVIALRSDFYDLFCEMAALPAGITSAPVVVAAPTEAELRRMVLLPAQAAGRTMEPDLVDRVIADSRCAAGALPLVSTAMAEAWDHHDGSTLTVAVYRAAGGVAGAVAALAERAWAGLDAAEQHQAKGLILRLCSSGDGDLARPVSLDELAPGRADTPGVLAHLVRWRLVTIDDGTVRVARRGADARVATLTCLAGAGPRRCTSGSATCAARRQSGSAVGRMSATCIGVAVLPPLSGSTMRSRSPRPSRRSSLRAASTSAASSDVGAAVGGARVHWPPASRRRSSWPR